MVYLIQWNTTQQKKAMKHKIVYAKKPNLPPQMILYDRFHLFKTSRKCKLIYKEEQSPGKEWRKLSGWGRYVHHLGCGIFMGG